MKLYNYDSPSPRRVRIFLAEKGLTAEMVYTDLSKGDHRAPDFIARNRLHAVPVLETDEGQFIPESIAICRYLDALQPDPPMFGVTPLEKATVEVWLQRVENNLLRTLGNIWVHGSPLTAGAVRQRIPELADKSRKDAVRVYDIFDEALGRTRYLAGDTFSGADVTALCTVDFGIRRELATYGPQHANLKRWHQEVSARPSASA